jgi:magnesium-transporting ATPase (P-type)
MIFNMAICHSVIPEYNIETEETIYNSSSPDESALVNGANFLGCQFLDRNEENIIKIKFKNRIYNFKLLYLFEFNSDRKRMSVIIKDEYNRIKLITKGADLVIFERIAKNEHK